MADPTVDATAKGANSNSYVTRAETQSYLDGRLAVTAWTAAAGADQDRAIITATSRLEQEFYTGSVTTTTQALQWPRSNTFDKARIAYDFDVVPDPVKEATYETALELLDGSLSLAPTGLEGFDLVEVGTIVVDPRHATKAGTLSANVKRILDGLLITSSGASVRTAKT